MSAWQAFLLGFGACGFMIAIAAAVAMIRAERQFDHDARKEFRRGRDA